MITILVTGSNGQLGTCFKKIVNEFNAESNYLFSTRDDFDITSEKSIKEYLDSHTIDVILNFAAYTNVDKAEFDECKKCYDINVIGPRYLSRECKKKE